MYNGIGLQTARGSGTNGYVQRNLAFIKQHKDKNDYKSEEELKKLDAKLNRGPNEEILIHEKKRKVELKCFEMQELMAEQGYSEEEIVKKVADFRQKLTESQADNEIETDEAGRPTAKASHQLAEASRVRNENLRQAFRIGEFFEEKSSLEQQKKSKEEAAKNHAMATKKYKVVESESESESDKETPPKKRKHKSPSRKDKESRSHSHKSTSHKSKKRKSK